jgi:hypothetical protein
MQLNIRTRRLKPSSAGYATNAGEIIAYRLLPKRLFRRWTTLFPTTEMRRPPRNGPTRKRSVFLADGGNARMVADYSQMESAKLAMVNLADQPARRGKSHIPNSRCRKSLKDGAHGGNRTCDLPLRRRLLYPLSYVSACSSSGSVAQKRLHVVALQFLASVEKAQFNDEGQPDDFAAEAFDELHDCGRRAAGGQKIVGD